MHRPKTAGDSAGAGLAYRLSRQMTDFNSKYSAAKDDLQAVANPLFDHGCEQVSKRGEFLPVGAKLTKNNDVGLIAAWDGKESTSAVEVLSLLLSSLNTAAKDAKAVAYCEWVQIGLNGGKLTNAVKVHVHHVDGVAVSFYIPSMKRLLRAWEFGEMVVQPADPIVTAWPANED